LEFLDLFSGGRVLLSVCAIFVHRSEIVVDDLVSGRAEGKRQTSRQVCQVSYTDFTFLPVSESQEVVKILETVPPISATQLPELSSIRKTVRQLDVIRSRHVTRQSST